MADLDLKVLLKVQDKASKELKKFRAELEKTKKEMQSVSQAQVRTGSVGGGGSSTSGGSDAGGGIGLLAGTAAIGSAAGITALLGKIASSANEVERVVSGLGTVMQDFFTYVERGWEPLNALNEAAQESSEYFKAMDEFADKAQDSIHELGGASKQTAKDVDSTGKAASKSTGPISRMGAALKDIKDEVLTLIRRLPRFVLVLGSLAAGFGAVALAIAPVIKHAIQVGPKFEKMRATLAGLVPETTNAGEAFAFITEVTKKVPASLDEVTQAYTRMIAMGITPTEERLLTFADIAAITGKSILQYAEAVADGLTGEFERFKEFGIKVSKEADGYVARMGETVIAAGKTTTEVLNNIENFARENEKFVGAAARQMDTYEGKVSNLGVAWDRLGDVVWQTALEDLFKRAADAVAGFVEWLTKAYLSTVKFFGSLDLIDKAKASYMALWEFMKGDKTWEEAAEQYGKASKAIDEATEKWKAEIDALMDGTAAAERHNKALKDLEETKNGTKPLVIEIKESEFSKFFRGLRESAQETIKLEEHLWQAQTAADELFQEGAISAEEYQLVLKEIEEQLNSLEDTTEETTDKMSEFFVQAARSMQQSMSDFFFDVMQGNMDNLAVKFKQTIDRMVADMLASELAGVLFGNYGTTGKIGGLAASTGSFLSGLIGRSSGGPMEPGQVYKVHANEIITPQIPSYVYPSKPAFAQAMGGETINNNITIQAMDSQSFEDAFENNDRFVAGFNETISRKYGRGRR